MADFKTKVITLAGMATMFAGMAFGQASLSGTGVSTTTGAIFVRAEGATELLPNSMITINNTGTASAVTFTVYLAPSLTITSQKNEATANGVVGTITGATVTFSNVPVAASAGPVASTTITIAGIRVNASTLATGSGIPQGVSEQVFLQGSSGTVTPGATGATIVAYATNGLVNTGTGAVNVTTIVNGTVCGGLASNAFTINLTEGFVGAFKVQGASGAIPTGESSTNFTATTGTGLSITFANVPSSVALYLPLTVTSTQGGILTLVASPTSPATGSNVVTASTAKNSPGAAFGAVPVSNNTATAYYEVTASSASAIDTYAIIPYEYNAPASLTGPVTAITATVSLAPSIAAGATPSTVPSFVGANTQQTVTGNLFTACSTTLLFPFVTNQAGFETGLAIANTSSDLLGTSKGVAITSATPQAGTCLLTFFGSATPAAFTTASVATGTDWTGTLTSVTGGTPGTFGGYMIAQCNFLYAHGFSYITYNIGAPNAMAMGYLALEVPLVNGARPVAATGTPESLNN